MHTVLLYGPRTWDQQWICSILMSMVFPNSVICHGGAKGADTMLAECLKYDGFNSDLFIVRPVTQDDWKLYGRFAAVKRTIEMIDEFQPNFGIGVWDGVSKGTRATLLELYKRNIPSITFVSTTDETYMEIVEKTAHKRIDISKYPCNRLTASSIYYLNEAVVGAQQFINRLPQSMTI